MDQGFFMKTVVYVDPQSGGNLAMYDYSLLKGICRYKVIYCCSEIYDAPTLANVEVHDIFHYNNRKNSILKGISYLLSLIRLVLLLREVKPEILHIQWWRSWCLDYRALSIYKRYCKQIVFTAHNLVPHNTGDSMVIKCRKYYEKVDKIIVHAKNTKEEMQTVFAIPEQKISVIPHGVLDFKVDDEKVFGLMRHLIEEYNLSNKILFSSLGGQSFYKGTDLIRDAFMGSAYLRNNKNVFLIIAGSGNIVKKKDIEEQCNNFIVFDYQISDEEFQAIMRLTDVLILPYRKISQSGVLLTAIQNQTPFAVTAVGGLAEPLEKENVGWIIDAPKVEEVRDCMERLVKEKESVKRIKMDGQAWSRIKTLFDWSTISLITEKCYDK